MIFSMTSFVLFDNLVLLETGQALQAHQDRLACAPDRW